MSNQQQGSSSIWRMLLWALVFVAIFYYMFNILGHQEQVQLTYTAFKHQVAQGNVESITMRGRRIEGSFRNQYYDTTAAQDTVAYKMFSTVRPSVEDEGLIAFLENNDVIIEAETEDNPWMPYLILLIFILPWVLIIFYTMHVSRRLQGGQGSRGGFGGGGLFNVGRSRAKKFNKAKIHSSYEDVAGLRNAKKDLQEIVEYLKEPTKFVQLGAEIPKGILLMGPPGTGKTLLSRATAGEAGVPFYSISGSEFIEMFVGVGASRVRDMFETAKKESPSIIFIDELDSIGRSRGTGVGGGHDEREQTLNQILSEMDGFEPHESVVVIAATNRPDILDPALTRPGRFDRQITLDLPEKKDRLAILKIHTRKVPISSKVDLENIAARTVGFSGADLKNLVNEAALLAGRKDRRQVFADDFSEASDRILLGAEREEKIGEEEKELIAYHEAGHALIAKLLPDTDPLQKVTIIARGRALGATEQIPEADRHNLSKRYLLARITVALGGRASEKIVFNEITNGAAQDLKNVKQIARRMVCNWGMSERFGPATFNQGEEHVFLGREMTQPRDFSEQTARIIDEEIEKLIIEMEERAHNLLKENRDKLDKIARALIENETLEHSEVDAILKAD
ncbi:MAG: ATP-dependent zinc metalloprotease FtsH [Chitinispirillaceae bacterium]